MKKQRAESGEPGRELLFRWLVKAGYFGILMPKSAPQEPQHLAVLIER